MGYTPAPDVRLPLHVVWPAEILRQHLRVRSGHIRLADADFPALPLVAGHEVAVDLARPLQGRAGLLKLLMDRGVLLLQDGQLAGLILKLLVDSERSRPTSSMISPT